MIHESHEGQECHLEQLSTKGRAYPDLRKYTALPDQHPSINRETTVKEKIPSFEQYLPSLNIFKCSVCMEYKIEAKPLVDDPNYICSTCNTRKDLDFFSRKNLHPVWYLVDDDRNYMLDTTGGNSVVSHSGGVKYIVYV